MECRRKGFRNITGSGPDTHYEWTYKTAGFKLNGESSVSQHVPNERLVVNTHGGVDSKGTCVLEPTPKGTKLAISVEYDVPVPVLGKLAEKLVVRRNDREIGIAIENIKDHCES